MIPELGHVALILALQLAIAQSVFGFFGATRENWVRVARSAAIGQCFFVTLGFYALLHAFVLNDFSVLNVAEHSSRHLPVMYRITAAWGSHEGSILLWTLILSGWTVVVALRGLRQWPVDIGARVLGVMGLVSIGFLAFILFTSNPFMRLEPPPPYGMDLNPLLQDPGMILHPPLLYMGYAGFSVAFAFAIAALMAGRLDAAWARTARPWTLVAWLFLTLGIAVGSWWAYVELGWGGWWFWDPAENSSLMPWLVATALLHSLAVTAQRDTFRVWTAFLAITTFSLSLLGTFLVRSGVLSSVHAFALDPSRGLFILAFLVVVIGGSLTLFALRAAKMKQTGESAILSRESLMLAGNVLLLVAMGTVLLGTLYPLILDAAGLGKISVGPPYFNAVFVPLMVPVLVLMGLAVRWKGASLTEVSNHFKWHALAAVVLGILLSLGLAGMLGATVKWPAVLGMTLASWILITTVAGLMERKATGGVGLSRWGMSLAHAGIAIGIIGIGGVSAWESEQNVAMKQGDTANVAGVTLTFKGVTEVSADNYSAAMATLELSRNGKSAGILEPEKRAYHASKNVMTESAIRTGITGDIYVALGNQVDAETWGVRLFHKPFIGWIWAGALLMVIGALLAALDRRTLRKDALQ
ncbi:MAG: heme lyase CcmF/NrfE family subunit [Rhodocyclaceae bacterium]|nr:heme lyase CcmF/NrfE family subunit [Rhodocyclaceae bacterium]